MGIPVLVMGESGSGKTYSLKNFEEGEIKILSVEKGRLPFKKNFDMVKNASYADIGKALKAHEVKAYAIDDSQYLLVNELFDTIDENGYDKFKRMAKRFRDMIHYVNHDLPDEVIVYFLHHTDTDKNSGKMRAKTVGKMLDDQLTLEGCFDIVLYTEAATDGHWFITQSDGFTTAKSPEDMFELRIPNDLKAVDTRIREYYGI